MGVELDREADESTRQLGWGEGTLQIGQDDGIVGTGSTFVGAVV